MARKKLLSEGEIRQFMKLANLRPVGTNRLSEMYDVPGARDEEDELRATEDELGDEDALADEEGDELAGLEDEMSMDDDAGAGGMVSMDDFMSALERAIEEVTGEEADVSEEPGDEEMDMEMGPEGDELEMSAEDEMVAEIVRRLQERQGADDREDEHLGAKDGKESGKKQSMKDRRKEMRGDRRADDEDGDPVPTEEGLADARPAPHRSPRRLRRRDDDEGFGAVGGMIDEPSEMEPAKEYDPDDPDESPRRRRRRDRSSSGGVGIKGVTAESEQVVQEVARRVARRLQAQSAKEQMVDQLAERIMKRLAK